MCAKMERVEDEGGRSTVLYSTRSLASPGPREREAEEEREATKRETDKKTKTQKKQRKQQKSKRDLKILEGRPTREQSEFVQRWKPLADAVDGAWVAGVLGETDSLLKGAILCLNEANARRKAALSIEVARRYFEGSLRVENCEDSFQANPPDEPPRQVVTVDPKDVPRRGKGGSLMNRIKLVHSLAHIESVAIDLSWDMVARFGFKSGVAQMPVAFFDDWVNVALDEAIHHLMWESRLLEMGSFYGEMATHSGLWDSAKKTSSCVMDRLAIEHMVLEARGLDVAPSTFKKFLDCDDVVSAEMLQAIYTEEIVHVANGITWFQFVHQKQDQDLSKLEERFHSIVREKLLGRIKPPFNVQARAKAGMPEHFYRMEE